MTSTDLAIRDGQNMFDAKQVAALHQLGVSDASMPDLAIFFHQCARTGLDPFARQIYMIGRKTKDNDDKWIVKQTIQTGIDGFRLIARRASDHRKETLGYIEDAWCGDDGVWKDVWLSSEPPAAAKVTILRNGAPFPAVAIFSEFKQTTRTGELTKMWREKPAHMIQKCAEALALRKAFPQDLSGLYTTDETGDEEPGVIASPAEGNTSGVRRMSREPEPAAAAPEPEITQAVSEGEKFCQTWDADLAMLVDEAAIERHLETARKAHEDKVISRGQLGTLVAAASARTRELSESS